MRLLWAVDHAFTSTSKRMERELGVTALQHLVTRLVARQPGVSAGALARTLHVHPSTLTGVLRRLGRRGALVRYADASDGRRALFRLTRHGHAIGRLEAGTPEARVEVAIASLPQDDLAAAARVLARIAAALAEA